eukprot:m.90637 g.90637  ORF g.90637 m.90637 type:complete len:483 (+) comp36660_c0_seq19:188-1636(+)
MTDSFDDDSVSERRSYRLSVVGASSNNELVQTVSQTEVRSDGRRHVASLSYLCGRFVAAICVAIALSLSLLPLVLGLTLEQSVPEVLTNATHSRLQELRWLNVSACPRVLLRNHQGACYFPCNQSDWLSYPSAVTARIVTNYVLGIFLVTSGVFITLVWIALGKSHWQFPHILLWYITVCLTGLGITSLATVSLGGNTVACSSDDFMEAQLNPTTECSALGSIFHFFLLAFTFWTCASSANMWWCICYPTRASSLFVETTKVHLLQSLVCWLVPAVCVAVNLGVQGGYSNLAEGSYSICMPSTRELAVVTFATPIVAASVFTVFLLFHTVYCLQKQSRFRQKMAETSCQESSNRRGKTKNVQQIESLKAKFFVLAIFVILLCIMDGVNASIRAVYHPKIVYLISETLLCWMNASQVLNSSTANCTEEFRDYRFPALEILSYAITLLCVPVVLNYVLTIKRARVLLWRWMTCPFRCLRRKVRS